MTLQELKESIENNTFKPTSMILVGEEKFIPLQYIRAMERGMGYSITYLESIEDINSPDDFDIFSDVTEVSGDLLILNTELVDFCDASVYNKNVIIIANKISKESKKYYSDIIIEIPKLSEWQIQDMAYSYGNGIDNDKLDWLIKHCNDDVNRLYSELSKLVLFGEAEKKILFDDMVSEGAFSDLSQNTVFGLTNAIAKRDVGALKAIYKELDNIDVSEFGLLSILYNNFLNILHIQLGINTSAASLGLKPGQFNAIRYNCGKYTNSQIVQIVDFLTDIDRKVKTGQLDTKIMIDYMILSILSF